LLVMIRKAKGKAFEGIAMGCRCDARSFDRS
jgi:hypothetical protein